MRLFKARPKRKPRPLPKDPGRAKNRAAIVKYNRVAEKKLAGVLLDFNAALRQAVPLKKMAAALAATDADGAFQLLPIEQVSEAAEAEAVTILEGSLRFGGELAAAQIRKATVRKELTLGYRFDIVNPRAVAFVRAHAGDMIKQFGVNANKELIREVLRRGFEEGLTPPQMAKLLRDRIGLTTRMVRQVSRFRDTLEKEGRFTREELQRKTSRLAAKLEARRALMIARTETVRATSAGQIQSLEQAKQAGIVGNDSELEWVILRDGKADEDCIELDGERVKSGELFPVGVDGPPLHPNCRCSLNIHAKPPASFKSRRTVERERPGLIQPRRPRTLPRPKPSRAPAVLLVHSHRTEPA